MKKVLIILLALLPILICGCDSKGKDNLRVALSSIKSKAEIKFLLEKGNLSKNLDKNCFTYFFLTNQRDVYNGYDVIFNKPETNPVKMAQEFAKKMREDGSIITLEEISNLSYSDESENHKIGSCSFHNEIFEGKLIFLTDEKNDGKVIKLCIPKKGKTSFENSLVIFSL